MFGTVPAGKSSHRWLDRLWTSRGFSDSTDPENLLQNPRNRPISETPEDSSQIGCPHGDDGDRNIRDTVSDVLNELFYFGDGCRSSSSHIKKSSRKAANPRNCAFPNGNKRDAKLWRCEDRSSRVAERKESNHNYENEEEARRGGGASGEGNSLSGFSRTEVTVIDTSCAVWKLEKLLYRKRNVWKVRDRKGNGEVPESKRRRKLINGGSEDIK
ncbi:hypothetical protein M569_12088 [Genlisea aurea]|uniref:Uncharacterized protein n=1 Tax=Genlisea aurea TaxID=192259 RepID=S8DSB1_9LAMI|nr:hypothetical protein M569_12088 [Genlisea aurea]